MDSAASNPLPSAAADSTSEAAHSITRTLEDMLKFVEPTVNIATLGLSPTIMDRYDPTCDCVLCSKFHNPGFNQKTGNPMTTSAAAKAAWHQGHYQSRHLAKWLDADSVARLAATHAVRRDHRRITGSDKCPAGITGSRWREYLDSKAYLTEWQAVIDSPGYTAERCGAQSGKYSSATFCENLVQSGGPFRSMAKILCCDVRHGANSDYSSTRPQNTGGTKKNPKASGRSAGATRGTSSAAGASTFKPWVSLMRWPLKWASVERHNPTCAGRHADDTACDGRSFVFPEPPLAFEVSHLVEMAKVRKAQRAWHALSTDLEAAEALNGFMDEDTLRDHHSFLPRFEELRALLGLSYCPDHRKEWDAAHPDMLDEEGRIILSGLDGRKRQICGIVPGIGRAEHQCTNLVLSDDGIITENDGETPRCSSWHAMRSARQVSHIRKRKALSEAGGRGEDPDPNQAQESEPDEILDETWLTSW